MTIALPLFESTESVRFQLFLSSANLQGNRCPQRLLRQDREGHPEQYNARNILVHQQQR